ncbi:Neurotransmitter-gated ion-channel ligand-binding domain-containing protein [Aphelenchoides besseyi]|nr:Neurotransmitter-gated ion-channel ligand-binding domain-containing protein [Aphelenchoides besseyi]
MKTPWHHFVIILLLIQLKLSNPLIPSVEDAQSNACQIRHNITDVDSINATQLEILENCLYYSLSNAQASHFDLIQEAPFDIPLKITIEQYVIHQVDLMQQGSSQFNIHGELSLSWLDPRLEFDEEDWKIKNFALHDNHHIWTPKSCGLTDGCISRFSDIEVNNEGQVSARFTFRYPAFCGVDYKEYPEETNDCCLLLSLTETDRTIKYDIQTKEKVKVQKPVAITVVEKEDGSKVFKAVETSAWIVADRIIDVVKVGSYRSEFLRLCVIAKKEMSIDSVSTLRIALRIPATIATLLMLVSPLFGDLKTQSFVKIFTLTLQTICFLFLCSIAPPNGFAGVKPKLYAYYEFIFFVSFLSILITLVCLALCRVQRSVPPSHFFYLSSKLINRFFCCIEPETNYQRHLEGFDGIDSNRGEANANRESSSIVDYTHEWRHIYIAANNLFSGVSFSIFCLVIIFEIL